MNTTNDLITQNDYPSPSIFTEDGYSINTFQFRLIVINAR